MGKALVIIVAALFAGLAIFCYTPLPHGISDPLKTQLFMSIIRIGALVHKSRELLGYGSPYQNILLFQSEIKRDGDLPSTKYGDVQVKRDIIEGVPVIIYRPNTARVVSPAMVYFHGGGWVLLTADEYDYFTYSYAKDTDIVVISVDYRRAPQFPFPAAAEDCLAVTRYVLRNGLLLGIDVKRVGVGGDSAGGNLAAVVSLAVTRENPDLPPLKFQLMTFPVLQAFDFRLPSYVDYNDTMPILSSRQMAAYTAYYMGLDIAQADYYSWLFTENRHIPPELQASEFAEYVSVKNLPKLFRTPNRTASPITASYDSEVYSKIKHIVTSPLFSPLMSSNLTGLPPAFIQACEFDVLRDEALLYSKRLQDAGVKVKLHFGHGGFHGDILRLFPDFMWVESGRVAYAAVCDFITTVLKD